ncbi:MAG: aspartyl-tRNA(Asn)/glutamyl-tRNA(Gln) amidotransferase subunit C [Saprospiraceae bacterium]|jgi:aspartyl-tRNA(Asn)/glutamyl-tRNA(Gln) amidotransferase subunit C
MQVDEQLVLRLEKLARLQLSEEEREVIQGDLNKILGMVDKLKEIDTDNVEPLVYMNEEVNVLREDVVRNQTPREDALRNAPAEDGTYFKVPKVIKS